MISNKADLLCKLPNELSNNLNIPDGIITAGGASLPHKKKNNLGSQESRKHQENTKSGRRQTGPKPQSPPPRMQKQRPQTTAPTQTPERAQSGNTKNSSPRKLIQIYYP